MVPEAQRSSSPKTGSVCVTLSWFQGRVPGADEDPTFLMMMVSGAVPKVEGYPYFEQARPPLVPTRSAKSDEVFGCNTT